VRVEALKLHIHRYPGQVDTFAIQPYRLAADCATLLAMKDAVAPGLPR